MAVGSSQLIAKFVKQTESLARQCAYLVGQLNIGSRCAELAHFLGSTDRSNRSGDPEDMQGNRASSQETLQRVFPISLARHA